MKTIFQFLAMLAVVLSVAWVLMRPTNTTPVATPTSMLDNQETPNEPAEVSETSQTGKKYVIQKSDAEWKAQLSPLAYEVARRKGTERAFSGEYYENHAAGVYICVCCGQEVFKSDDKFESGTGWPSYTRTAASQSVEEVADRSYGMMRTEVNCSRCGAHLGHVFPDGPKPTGMRYCINSVSLGFEEKK